jgi:phage-related tail protein
MSIYKYQIIKYLEDKSEKNKDEIKKLKKLNRDELMKEIKYFDKSQLQQLTKYLNQRKNRKCTNITDIIQSNENQKFKVIIDWNTPFVWL